MEKWKPGELLIQSLTLLLLFGTVIVAFSEYRAHLKISTIEQSLNFSTQLQSDHLAKARWDVLRPWLGIDVARLDRSAVSDNVFKDLVSEIVSKNAREDGGDDIRASIVQLTEYFDTAYACVKNKLCEEASLKSLVGDFGHAFYCLYGNEIELLRKRAQLQDFGLGAQSFSASMGKC